LRVGAGVRVPIVPRAPSLGWAHVGRVLSAGCDETHSEAARAWDRIPGYECDRAW
jgi:hypothetical protein